VTTRQRDDQQESSGIGHNPHTARWNRIFVFQPQQLVFG
jgi:hypothetical protein